LKDLNTKIVYSSRTLHEDPTLVVFIRQLWLFSVRYERNRRNICPSKQNKLASSTVNIPVYDLSTFTVYQLWSMVNPLLRYAEIVYCELCRTWECIFQISAFLVF